MRLRPSVGLRPLCQEISLRPPTECGRRPWRPAPRALVLLVLLLLVGSGLVVLPGSTASSTVPTGPPSPGGVISNATVVGTTFAGQDPASDSVAPARVLDETILPSNGQSVLPLNPYETPTDRPVAGPPSTPTRSSSNPTPPGEGPIATGYVNGTVVDAEPPHLPLSGAQVSAEPLAGFCPPSGCVPVATDANGQFKVLAAVGENVIEVSDPFYVSNRAWTYVTAGSVVDAGTISLVPDGTITGRVLGADPAHEAIGGILVTAQTRDGTFTALPEAHTNSTGGFTAAVPPVPSEVEFSSIFPFAPYEANYTWVNVSAGATLNVGVIYLQRYSPVSIDLVDSATGAPITSLASIQVTSKTTGYQTPQGSAVNGPTIRADAPVGPDQVTVFATGYLVDHTDLGNVPATRPGSPPIFMRTIELVPLGAIIVNVGVQGGMSSLGIRQWGIGQEIISATSIDGRNVATGAYNPLTGNFSAATNTGGCDPYVGDYVEFAAFPLRDYITVTPDTSGQCGFGGVPTWPIPGELPVFENYAWANVTPDLAVDIGHVDLLPGTYVQGQVLPASVSGWDVTTCSTDEPALCAPGSFSDQEYLDSYTNYVPAGCPQPGSAAAPYTFCVATPPGPFEAQVVIGNATGNYTWGYNPPYTYSQLPLLLSGASQTHTQSINLTAGRVTGRVLQERSLTPVGGLPAVKVCPAGTSPPAVSCGTGVANATGYFSVSAPPGWDKVTVSATDYLPNSTWLYVRAENSSGTILLTPYGYVSGQVVDASGAGVYEATVRACPMTASVRDPSNCNPLGADGGLTSTTGGFYGPLPAGQLPEGSYLIYASAPGYEADWTWVNVTTPGENFTAPRLVLPSLSSNGSIQAGRPGLITAAPTTAAGNGSLVGGWFFGRVIDGATGLGLPTASLTVQGLDGGLSTPVNPVRGTGGEFNDSVAMGSYWLNATLPGFYPASVTFNLTGNTTLVDIGTIAITPYPTVTGRLVIDPWRTVSYDLGLGPGSATVTICTSLSAVCAPGASVDSSGFFNASAPVGVYDEVFAQGGGSGTGTFNGGFVGNTSSLNVTGAGGPSLTIGLGIFGVILGTVDANQTRPVLPVWADTITADSSYPIDATQGESLNMTGQYTIFFPPAAELNMTAGGVGSWIPQARAFTLPPGSNQTELLRVGGVADLDLLAAGPSFRLEHFGWISAQIDEAASGLPVPFATMSVSEPGTLWGTPTSWTAGGTANAAGYLNLSAPPSLPKGTWISVNVSAPDYGFANAEVQVNSSRTTYLNGTNLSAHGFDLALWGWVEGTVLDSVRGTPLAGALPVVTDPGGNSGTTNSPTSGRGYFMVDAPPSPRDHLSITLAGYTSNFSYLSVGPGQRVTDPTVELVGYGVVQGRVVAYPSGAPVPGASVSVCPQAQPTCVNVIPTNATGAFAIEAPPGTDVITISATGYVTTNPSYVQVTSDTWVWDGTLIIDQYAFVTGFALGLPGGLPLAGANASLCALPTSGTGAGPCFVTSLTHRDGSFLIPAPAGTYVLDLNATYYNDSYLSVSLSPGETLPVGTIFLLEYGAATGAVAGANNGLPIPGARVSACQSWGGGTCLPTLTTDGSGHFVLSGPPGPYQLDVGAPGYDAGFASILLQSGATIIVPTFYLVPIGPGNSYPVSGYVLEGPNGTTPVSGAIITATGGFSTSSNALGYFSFLLPWGTYQISAVAPGFDPVQRTVTVDGAIFPLTFELDVATFPVEGTVVNGLTGTAVSQVQIEYLDGSPLGAPSSASGAYAIDLANGSYFLRAVPPATSTLSPVDFAVTVQGAPVHRDLVIDPYRETIQGLVTNGLTGAAVPGAVVTLSGTTADGVASNLTATAGPDGRFVLAAYPGSYSVVAQAGGYLVMSTGLNVTYSALAPTAPLTLALLPASQATASGPGWVGAAWVVLTVTGGLALAVVVFVVRKRLRPRGPEEAPKPGR